MVWVGLVLREIYLVGLTTWLGLLTRMQCESGLCGHNYLDNSCRTTPITSTFDRGKAPKALAYLVMFENNDTCIFHANQSAALLYLGNFISINYLLLELLAVFVILQLECFLHDVM